MFLGILVALGLLKLGHIEHLSTNGYKALLLTLFKALHHSMREEEMEEKDNNMTFCSQSHVLYAMPLQVIAKMAWPSLI